MDCSRAVVAGCAALLRLASLLGSWASGGPLGASWGLLGGLLGPPGSFLGPRARNVRSGPPPGPPSEAVLGASWAVLGPSWGRLGSLWGPSLLDFLLGRGLKGALPAPYYQRAGLLPSRS
eukprot:138280-Pyramimonas_sp.AAC.1